MLIGGQTCCQSWPFFGSKQIALTGGQTAYPYWGTNKLPLLGDKQVALIGGQIALIGGQIGRPYWGTNR